ncbi:MAG TPA: hypothetical protein PLM16_02920 [Candidatus Woesebacteria bacterium]|nr:hypothetical protein [Candidatus Woesebacteria bacterium]
MLKKLGLVKFWSAFFIMLIATVLVFGSSLNNEFVWDDEEQIVNNGAVHSLRSIPQLFVGSTFNSGGASTLGGLYYKPMMPMVFALVISLGGLNPIWIRSVQVMLHLLNSLMIFVLLTDLAKKFESKISWSLNILSWFSLALSLLFLLHPLNVETAIYLSSLQDVLFMSFGLMAVLIVQKTAPSVKTIVLTAVCLLFSLLSKETGLLMVVWIVLMAQLVRLEWRLATQGIANSTILFYLFMRFMVAGIGIQAHNLSPITRSSLWERVITIPKIINYYLTNLVWPTNLAISQHWVVTQLSLTDFWLPLGLVLVVMGACLLVWQKAKKRYGISHSFYYWTLLSLILLMLAGGLHLQFVPLDMTVADRWFYLPFVALILIMGLVNFRADFLSVF